MSYGHSSRALVAVDEAHGCRKHTETSLPEFAGRAASGLLQELREEVGVALQEVQRRELGQVRAPVPGHEAGMRSRIATQRRQRLPLLGFPDARHREHVVRMEGEGEATGGRQLSGSGHELNRNQARFHSREQRPIRKVS